MHGMHPAASISLWSYPIEGLRGAIHARVQIVHRDQLVHVMVRLCARHDAEQVINVSIIYLYYLATFWYVLFRSTDHNNWLVVPLGQLLHLLHLLCVGHHAYLNK
jgi:hypothetical protein